jgi:hypothetical protein
VAGPEEELALARWSVEHCAEMAGHYETLAQRIQDDPDFSLEMVIRMMDAGDDEAYPAFGCMADEYTVRWREAQRNVARLSLIVLLERRRRQLLHRPLRHPQHRGRRQAGVRRCRSSHRPRAPARPDDDPDLDDPDRTGASS